MADTVSKFPTNMYQNTRKNDIACTVVNAYAALKNKKNKTFTLNTKVQKLFSFDDHLNQDLRKYLTFQSLLFISGTGLD